MMKIRTYGNTHMEIQIRTSMYRSGEGRGDGRGTKERCMIASCRGIHTAYVI
jgi:hypothetical protein